MIAYIDGAENGVDVACGVVLLYQDVQIEHQFKIKREGNAPKGLCEFFALIKLVQLTIEMGVPFRDVSVYSDCQKVTQAQYVLHKGNHVRSGRRDEMMRNIEVSCKTMIMDEQFIPVLLNFIEHARFTWVKGHKNTVYNQRADYLAYGCLVSKDGLPYSKWVQQGFCLYENGQPVAWYPPFSKEEENDDNR